MDRQQLLPLNKNEYAARCRAIESISAELTPGDVTDRQLAGVRRMLKHIFKHRLSNFEGTMTFVRVRRKDGTPLSLSWDMDVSKRTLDRWIARAVKCELAVINIDTDERGNPRTTLSIRWAKVHQYTAPDDRPSTSPMPDSGGESRVPNPALVESKEGKLVENQSAMVSDQSATVSDQSATVSDQSATVSLSLLPITKSQPPPTPTAPSGGLVVEDLDKGEGKAIEFVATELRRAGIVRVAQLAREFAFLEPATISAAVDTYLANQGVIGPGALASFLRDGVWPVENIIDPSVARRRREAKERDAAANAQAGQLWKRIKQLRREYFQANPDAVDVDEREFAKQLAAEGFETETIINELWKPSE